MLVPATQQLQAHSEEAFNELIVHYKLLFTEVIIEIRENTVNVCSLSNMGFFPLNSRLTL